MRTKHLCVVINIRIKGEVDTFSTFKPSSYFILLTVRKQCFFGGFVLLFMLHVCLCYAVLYVPCSRVITCWERADLFALLCDVLLYFCHCPK